MTRLRRLAPAVLLCGALLCRAEPGATRTFLVGVDGGSWNVIDALRAEGGLPHFSRLMERGASAEMATVEPVSSPVVWTSLATGRSPAAHGVTDFFATRLSVGVPSSYERLAAMGHRVGLYDQLMTWPPVALPGGFVIPGWLRRDAATSPADVWDRIPLSPFTNEYATARGGADYLARARREVVEKPPRFLALAEAFGLDLAVTTFYAADMTSHRFWHGFAPGDFAEGFALGIDGEATAVADAMRGVDRALGAVLDAMGPEDHLIVVSDHGFRTGEREGRNVWVTRVEALLPAAGLEPERDGFAVVGTFGAVTLRIHPGDVERGDAVGDRLLALLRSLRGPDGAPLYRAVERIDVAPRPAAHRRPWTTRLRQWAVRQLVTFAFGVELGDDAHSVLFALPDDGALAPLWPDGRVEAAGRSWPLRELMSRDRFTGTHDPTAIFLAVGPAVAPGTARAQLSVLDVAPLLFHLAGEPVPDDLEGRLPAALLRPEWRAEHPPRSIRADRVPALPASARTGSAIDDPGLVEKLRSLGYLE